MTTTQLIYLGLVFLAVFAVSMLILSHFGPRLVQQRLDKHASSGEPAVVASEPAWVPHMVKLSSPIAKLLLPAEGWEESKLRIRFMNAGYRTSSAPVLYFAAKAVLTVVVPGLLLLYAGTVKTQFTPNTFVIMLVVLAALGYFL